MSARGVKMEKKTSAKAVYVETPALLGALRTRNVSPVTIFRGDLELSSKMKIKVWVYKKTIEERFPTLKKYSDKAPPTDRFATHEVKYGPQVVPISSAEWDVVKFKPEKSVKLLGFADASNIMQ
ncbi:ATP-dependent DNA helicase 2 subunit KU80-like [Populus alba x Populus x berolinensis]|uniref:ATP-dependent DNA helicase 2 subunit KU80-like n=1 Tax=Populus alba x Populus x berolinensis TaxID=444605 RepID=A0AAD6RES0_9ROSI|nr:ATP-dependent DNA helicase 2 subunit KU80-like [Populus alba x Populus x berolinensis]